MSCDWLTHININNIGENEYSLLDIRRKFEVTELISDVAWAVLFKNEDPENNWLKFAIIEFSHKTLGSPDTNVSILFHGEGPSGSLRECRHTYWGKDGYIFYPKGKTIKLAMDYLSQYFEMD